MMTNDVRLGYNTDFVVKILQVLYLDVTIQPVTFICA